MLKKALLLGMAGLMIGACEVTGQFSFSTVAEDSLTADTITYVYSSGLMRKRLREVTFVYDHHDSCVAEDMDSSRIILWFNDDSSVTTWDTVKVHYSADTVNPLIPGLWRLYEWDTGTMTISGRLSGMNFPLDSFKIGIFNASDSVATFKAGIIWEDVFTR